MAQSFVDIAQLLHVRDIRSPIEGEHPGRADLVDRANTGGSAVDVLITGFKWASTGFPASSPRYLHRTPGPALPALLEYLHSTLPSSSKPRFVGGTTCAVRLLPRRRLGSSRSKRSETWDATPCDGVSQLCSSAVSISMSAYKGLCLFSHTNAQPTSARHV